MHALTDRHLFTCLHIIPTKFPWKTKIVLLISTNAISSFSFANKDYTNERVLSAFVYIYQLHVYAYTCACVKGCAHLCVCLWASELDFKINTLLLLSSFLLDKPSHWLTALCLRQMTGQWAPISTSFLVELACTHFYSWL